MSRQLNMSGPSDLLKLDRARARQFSPKHSNRHFPPPINEGATNLAFSYIVSVGVGSPPTQYNLIVDTGSSNTWVGANKPYVRTKTSRKTRDSVAVSYGTGHFEGTEFIDTVTLDGLVVTKQSIGVASTSAGFGNLDGILGIGPADLTVGTLSPDSGTSIPTVTDNAFKEHRIPANEIGISFAPTQSSSIRNGEITWGGVDRTKFTGSIHFTPITSTSPSNRYWGIDQSITYGFDTILPLSSGIVDTGTTLILLAPDAFERYQVATGGVLDPVSGLLTITHAQYRALRKLKFHINGKTFSLTPNAQIWPRSLNSLLGGNANTIFLVVTSFGGVDIPPGLDFLNGQAFLERFYSVYDTTNQRVGLATTPFTTATTN